MLNSHAHTSPIRTTQPLQVLTPADRASVLQHLQELTPEDRCRRFGFPVAPAYLDRYVDTIQFGRDVLLGLYQGGDLIALCQLARYPGNACQRAEVGLSIAASHRRLGLGTRLLSACIAEAVVQGIETIEVNYTYENTAMAKLCKKFGATRTSESGCVCATLQLQPQKANTQTSQQQYKPDLALVDRGTLTASRTQPRMSRDPVCALLCAALGGLIGLGNRG
jgi:RimJ/RimL family protein N-acetyltransferase